MKNNSHSNTTQTRRKAAFYCAAVFGLALNGRITLGFPNLGWAPHPLQMGCLWSSPLVAEVLIKQQTDSKVADQKARTLNPKAKLSLGILHHSIIYT